MKTKQEITGNWLERYTKMAPQSISKYILLTNFNNYVDIFCDQCGVEHVGYDANMRTVTADGITMINFGMGSPNAALIADLISSVQPEACLFLGKCGGVADWVKVGDFLLPAAAVRGEGTSNDYMPPEVPAQPDFALQHAASTALKTNKMQYCSGTVYTTNRRVWEHDEEFKKYLRQIRVVGIDMECATLFTCAQYNQFAMGALLLVSDRPMEPEGVKTIASDNLVNANYASLHVQLGIQTLRHIMNGSETISLMKR